LHFIGLLSQKLPGGKKAGLPEYSFGSPAIFHFFGDPPLSVPPSRTVWLYRKFQRLFIYLTAKFPLSY
jgi:hypothetical protein